jgi:hypothetical protein
LAAARAQGADEVALQGRRHGLRDRVGSHRG